MSIVNRAAAPLFLLVLTLAAAMPAGAQEAAAYQTNFDDDTGWTLDTYYGVQWGVDDTPIPGFSASNSLNYNNASGTFATGDIVYGDAFSPTIDMTSFTECTLLFSCRYQTEDLGTSYDVRYMFIYDVDNAQYLAGGTFASDGSGTFSCSNMDEWHVHIITLDPSLFGGNRQINFYFDSGDGLFNDYQGWFIDDLIVAIPDVTPPDTIADLDANTPELDAITVTWTSPADDSITGAPATFDLRQSKSPITAANFANATPVTGEPAPDLPGTPHSLKVTGLAEDTTYFFAIRTTDQAGNISQMSNVASDKTLKPPAPPPSVGGGPSASKEAKNDDILPCSAGMSATPGGLAAVGFLMGLAAAFRRNRRK